jgi:hypothetical protein
VAMALDVIRKPDLEPPPRFAVHGDLRYLFCSKPRCVQARCIQVCPECLALEVRDMKIVPWSLLRLPFERFVEIVAGLREGPDGVFQEFFLRGLTTNTKDRNGKAGVDAQP